MAEKGKRAQDRESARMKAGSSGKSQTIVKRDGKQVTVPTSEVRSTDKVVEEVHPHPPVR